MNRAKQASQIDGKAFLREALQAEQEVLKQKLRLSSSSISHDGVMGEVNEQHFIEILQRYLPKRYAVSQGIVIDCNGSVSDQIDIIIYDPQYTPPLLDQHQHRYILAESVYAVFEVKQAINASYLTYAAEKANSVRGLERTTVPIPHAGGQFDPKALFPILAGIVGIRAEWAEGLLATSFQNALDAFQGNATLSMGLALEDRAFSRDYAIFDTEMKHGELIISDPDGSLAWFLFTLLKRLQDLGTCPAVDWNRYRALLQAGSQNNP